MDLREAMLDAARPRTPLGAAGYLGRARAQRGDSRGLPPPRPPPSRAGEGGSGVRGRGQADEEVGGAGKGNGGVSRREVAVGAGAGTAGANAAAIAGGAVARAWEESGGGGGDVGSKRWWAPPAHPPPKRRAVSARRHFPPGRGRDAAAPQAGADAGPRFGDARAVSGSDAWEKPAAPPPPLDASKDGALLGALSPSAVGMSALKLSAADGIAPVADGGHHVPEAGLVKSLEASGCNGVAAVEDMVRGAGSAGLWGRKELVPVAHLRAKRRIVSAWRSFPRGCGRDAASLPAGRGVVEVQLPLESGPSDGDLGVSGEMVATEGRSSLVDGHAKESVATPCNRTIDGAIQDKELEEGEIPPEVQGSQVSTSVTLLESTACRHRASVPEISAVETSAMQSSNEDTDGNTLQCEEKRSSWLVGKDVQVMNKSIRSSCNVAAESLVEDSSKQNLMGKRVSESARMKRASSDVAAGLYGQGTTMRSKVMFTPRKAVKTTKVIQKSALDAQHRPFSEDKEKETEVGRRVITDGIEDTDELTTNRVMQAPMSSDKCPMTQRKEADTIRGSFGPRKKVKAKDPAHLPMKVASACALNSKEKLDDKMASSLDDDDILKALVVHEGKLELYLNSSSGIPSLRCQRQYGSQNADARSKFKMMCRRFEFICRALVQAVEQRSLKIRRIDLVADKAIRKLPGFTKHGPIIGQVPGVEVGDEFLYRVQLAIVGLHRVYQGGIDTTKDRNGVLIAISIVASGGYPDELSCSGELIYTGSGGKPAGKKDDEDQKLERGNLALKNCIKTKTPVRVIHGFKGLNTEGGSHSRAKQVSTFTYDGLYHVVDFWIDGHPGSRVFKYKLQKIPGQPELPMHIAKGMRKSKMRPGLCMVDISQGKEATPICVINTVDDVRPPSFRYITRIKYPFGLTKICHQGCDCTNGCSDSASCACAVKNGGEIPFNFNGAIVHEKSLIFECGPSCKCPPSCHNRVSQHGMKIPLEVFRTTKTGWGIRSLRSISSGSFICEYVGELLHGKEADERRNNDYLFDRGLKYDEENLCNGLLSTGSGLNSTSSCSQTMEDVGFTIDAAEYGNIGRFINHSCSPNLYAQNVLWDHDDKRMPHIMFFATETIPPLQELTYDYNYEIDHFQDANGKIKFKVCQCSSPQCCGRLY